MAFQGRDRGRRVDIKPDRGSGPRGLPSRRRAAPCGPIESLESRVLLSSVLLRPITHPLPIAPAVIPPPSLPSVVVHLQNQPGVSAPLIASTIPTVGAIKVSGASLLNIVRVKHPTPVLMVPTSGVGEPYVSITSMSESAISYLNEYNVSPIIVVASPGDAGVTWWEGSTVNLSGSIAVPIRHCLT